MAGPFSKNTYTTTADATPMLDATAVTPADTDLAKGLTRGILCGGTGNLVVRMASGVDVTLVIPATACGFVLPIAAIQIRAATTATSVVAFH